MIPPAILVTMEHINTGALLVAVGLIGLLAIGVMFFNQ
jgi:hypothetical protein